MSPSNGSDTAIPERRLRVLFALLYASPEPVSLDRIRDVVRDLADDESGPGGDEEERFSPRQHLEALEHWIAERDLPLHLTQVGKAFRMLTTEDVSEPLTTVRKQVHQDRLGPAALEVLALVAYRQPVLKADVDAIRGVNSGPHLRHLLDLRLVRILGRAELPGRPFLYGTTREFLDRFGLRDLEDLPEAGRLAAPAEAGPAPSEPADAPAEPEEATAEEAGEAPAAEAEEGAAEETEAVAERAAE